MRQMTPKDYMQMLGDRDALIFLMDEEIEQLKEKVAVLQNIISEKESAVQAAEAKVKELTVDKPQEDLCDDKYDARD